MLRSISVLNLPEPVKLKLIEIGYEYCEDVEKALLNVDEMPDTLKFIAEKYNLTKQLNCGKAPEIMTAVELWNFESVANPAALFHEGLDKLLGGGFPVGQITEIYGAPGSGKTQICLQAAIDVQAPAEVGGSSGESLFVSTDFGFTIERLRQMARESVSHFSRARDGCAVRNFRTNFTVENVLRGVKVIRVCGHKSLVEVVSNLEKYLKTNGKIKLVVVDSFSLPLVCEVTDLLERTKIIHMMLDILLELSMKSKFAVVLTNQLTTILSSDSETPKLIPSLGATFGHRLHKRLLLDDGKICLMKSNDRPQLFTEFQITKEGIR